MTEATKIDMWAIVELMGHQRMAGKVTEETIAGHGFLRIDVPACADQPAVTRYVAPGSVYAINPTTQELATRAASAWRPKPVSEFDLPRLPAPAAPKSNAPADHATELSDDEDEDRPW